VDAWVFKVKYYLPLGANKRALCVVEVFLVCKVVDVLLRRLVVFILIQPCQIHVEIFIINLKVP
jgi:hypothetical protein